MKIRYSRGSASERAKESHYLSDRILVTAPYRAEFTMDADIEIRLNLDLDREIGRIVCRSISLQRYGEGTEITGTDLRDIPVATLVGRGGDEMIRVRGTAGDWVYLMGAGQAFLPAEGRDRHEVVADAAVIYTVSSMTRRTPLKYVAERLRVSQSTATRLVSEARRDGLLTDG